MIQAMQHSRMLRDTERLSFFRNALETFISNNGKANYSADCVDIGSGTGVLSELASDAGFKKIHLIEYYQELLNLSIKGLREESRFFEFHLGRSFDVHLKLAPNSVLVTETIGLLGPEENIVEITYDFCKRHPEIQTLIPAELELYAVPFRSYSLNLKRLEEIEVFKSFKSTQATWEVYARNISSQNYWLNEAPIDFVDVGKTVCLAKYLLGKSAKSSFEVLLPNLGLDVFWHFFFVARNGHLTLETKWGSKNHWNFCFTYPCLSVVDQGLKIFYTAGCGEVKIQHL